MIIETYSLAVIFHSFIFNSKKFPDSLLHSLPAFNRILAYYDILPCEANKVMHHD